MPSGIEERIDALAAEVAEVKALLREALCPPPSQVLHDLASRICSGDRSALREHNKRQRALKAVK